MMAKQKYAFFVKGQMLLTLKAEADLIAFMKTLTDDFKSVQR